MIAMQTVALSSPQWIDDYRLIERAIAYIERQAHTQPDLKEVARQVGLSEYHFQRVFTRWVGVSPKRFLQFITKEHAKAALQRSRSVLDAAYESGLSGPGRLHDLLVTYEAATPGEVKSGGQGLEMRYGFHPSPLGECLLALSPRGVSFLAFVTTSPEAALADLRRSWPLARLLHAPAETAPMAEAVFAFFTHQPGAPIPVHLRGGSFQLKVWEALLRIPPGSVVTYQDLAVYVGLPAAPRAVGAALGRNPLPVLIPCHRAIHKTGAWGGYRFGSARKLALLGWEFAQYT
jgi:AraC family transcriptional regulator, regulatory protein of adaptative response / methylated-DNA-[protein]-cysteine methyltransferase